MSILSLDIGFALCSRDELTLWSSFLTESEKSDQKV